MAKDVWKRVEDSFDADHREDAYKYSDWLRTPIADTVQSVRRSAITIVLLVAIFEIITESPKAVISLYSFQIGKGSVVLQFLPVFVAYLLLQVMRDTMYLGVLSAAFSAAFEKWSPEAVSNDLDLLVQASLPFFWKLDRREKEGYGVLDKEESQLGFTFWAFIVAGVYVFEIQAFYLLYVPPPGHLGHLVLWSICLCVALFLSIMTLRYLDLGPDRFERK